MRTLLVIGGLALVAVGLLVGLVLFDSDEGAVETPQVLAGSDTPEPNVRPGRDQRIRPGPQPERPKPSPDRKPRPGKDAQGPVTDDTVQKFGQEFEARWRKDRERLGAERHKEMERLWFEGRRPRGDPESIEKLEKLLEEFPDTNRAGCAAMELGHHYMRSRSLPMEERRKKAAEYWHRVEDRYSDVLCEYNAPAAGMSKLALATWIYRSTDPGMARRLLQEVIDKHEGETDHLGRPLSATAKRILERLK